MVPDPDRRVPVLVYRETLVAASEPFITAQAENLTRHRAHYLGLRQADGHPLPPDRSLVWRKGGVAPAIRLGWKVWGLAPGTGTYAAIKKWSPRLVHAHFGRDAVQILPAAVRLGLPLVTTFHGHDATRSDADLEAGSFSDRLFLRRRHRLPDRGPLLAVSDYIRTRLAAIGLDARVHYIGVDVGAIASRASRAHASPVVAGVSSPTASLLFVGRLVDQKGLDDLLDAMPAVRAGDGSTPKLLVIGDGPLRREAEQRARRLRLQVDFLGARSQGEVWDHMAAANVVVVPSRTTPDGRAEAFGLVAAEAQAAMTPVVATRTGGLPEAIDPRHHRRQLVEERRPDLLAAAISSLLSEPKARDALGRAGRTWVAAHRNLRRQSAVLDDIYDEVVAA